MKLVLKRVGERLETFDPLKPPFNEKDFRALALHDAATGECLPSQLGLVINSDPRKPLTVTVTFVIDGKDLVMGGDAKGRVIPAVQVPD